MNRREFLQNCGRTLIASLVLFAGGCQYWYMFAEEMNKTDEMFIESFRRSTFLSWNINAGLGLDGKRDLARIAEVIKGSDRKVVALQEIDRKTRRANGEDQFEKLEQLLGMKGFWCRTSVRDEGEVGMALFLKEPKGKAEVVELPGNGAMLGIKLPEMSVAVVSFPSKDEDRDAAAAKIATMIEAERPFFLLGDWDENCDSEFMRKLRRSFSVLTGFDKTYPADEPECCFDYIAVSARHRQRYEHVSHEVLPVTAASDHRPVTVSAW